MPGVPFSKGCELCKKRRVKCDEQKPTCGQCNRLGKPCPGYRRENKFIDEGPRLERKRLAGTHSHSRTLSGKAIAFRGGIGHSSGNDTRSEEQSTASTVAWNDSSRVDGLNGVVGQAPDVTPLGTSSGGASSTVLADHVVPPSSPSQGYHSGAPAFVSCSSYRKPRSEVPRPIAATGPPVISGSAVSRMGFQILVTSHIPMIHCGRLNNLLASGPLDGPALAHTLRTAVPVPSWVWYLPAHLNVSHAGSNGGGSVVKAGTSSTAAVGGSPASAALDAAADCTFTVAGRIADPDPSAHDLDAVRRYTIAVARLRSAIEDEQEAMRAEVLAAVCLLSIRECLRSSDPWTWWRHQRAIYRLMERRGPQRYQTDLERQMLISNIGTLFCVALRDNHGCFLDQPAWQPVIETVPADSILPAEWTETYRCLPLLAHIPRLMMRARSIVHNSTQQTPAQIAALVAAAAELKTRFVDMMEPAAEPGTSAETAPRTARYSPVLAPRRPGEQFRYLCDREDMRTAHHVNYLSAIIMLNRILLALRPSATTTTRAAIGQQPIEAETRAAALEIQYLHSFVKAEPRLRGIWLVHPERVAMAAILTSTYWDSPRTDENGCAFDPDSPDGGRIIEAWKFDEFDDIMCARRVEAPLMPYKYPKSEWKFVRPTASTVAASQTP